MGPATRVVPRDRGELGHLGLWRTAWHALHRHPTGRSPAAPALPLRISADRRRAGDNQTTTRGDDGRPGREQTCGHHRRTATRRESDSGLCPSFAGVDNGSVGGDNGSRLRVFPARGVGRAFAVPRGRPCRADPTQKARPGRRRRASPRATRPGHRDHQSPRRRRDPLPRRCRRCRTARRAARTSIPAATTITEQEPAPTAVTCRRAHTCWRRS